MFARAVQKHRESLPPPKPAPSQPAPTRAQASIQGSFRQPPTVPVSQAPPSYHPVAPPARPYAESQSSQTRDGLVKALNNSSSFQENDSASTNSYQPPLDSMAALHEAVYFDEGDFDDDLDLDFDLSESFIQPSLAAAAARLPSPPPPPVRKPVMAQDTYRPSPAKRSYESVDSTWNVHKSSTPLPWSSSPVEHFKSPKSARVAQSVRQFSPDLPRENEVVDVISEDARPPKRRTLPWIEGAARGRATKRGITESEEVGSARNSATNSTSRRSQRVPAPSTSRSLMSHEKKSQAFPWNQSMRDFKAAQKDLKGKSKTQTRSIMTQGDPDEVEKIKKKMMVPAKLFLSDEQKSVLKLVTEGSKSVFFTGSAGTGKSVLLREVITSLRHKYRKDQDRVAVTASTGLAACNIGGVTLHSFSGIGLGKESAADLVQKIKRNRKAKERWIRTKVLVIDEISMVDGDLFDKLETIARTLKNNGRPFGGIQLIITGDFFQLPPVPDSGRMSKFAFEADTWNTSIEHTIGLTHVFRQKDPEFAGMLNEMRLGSLSKETIQCFRGLCRPIKYDDGLDATELFPTRGEVDAANNAKMRQLSGSSQVFLAEDGGTIQEKSFRDKLLNNCMAPISIELKINSQVMLIKNIDESLVNGSLGRVVGFMNEKTFDILQEDTDDLDAAINLGSDDEEKELTERRRKIRALAKEKAVGSTAARQWPLVQFSVSDGTTRQLLVQPEQWKVELPNGEVQAFRSQIPLILAWALSIHKAQGQTLERVKVDLRKVFEKGQAYVALSRATCQEGLQVLGFEERKVMAHGKVSEFYRSLYSVHEAAAPKANAQSGPKRTTLNSAQNPSESRVSYTGSSGRRTADPMPPNLDFSDDEAEAMMAMAEAF